MRATMSFRRLRVLRLLAVAAAILVALPASIGVVNAAPEKSYSLAIDPVTLVAGQTYGGPSNPSLILTIANTSPQPTQLGSLNLTVPAGIVITSATASQGAATIVGSAPQVIELRNLGLAQGSGMTVTFGADVECSSANAPYVWLSHGKQSNDFNGTGNDLVPSSEPLTNSVSGTCRLVFSGQPADARTGETVTTGDFDPNPSASPVEVTVATGDISAVDAVTWGSWTITLSADGPGVFTAGSDIEETTAASGARTADFTPALTAPGLYRLGATTGTTDVTNATSNDFVVVDVAVQCAGSGPCTSGSRSATRSSVEVSTTSSTGGFATVSFNPAGTEGLCGSGTDGSDVFDVNITESDANKTVRITIAKAFVTKPAKKYNVCVRLAEPFTTADGEFATEGNLPDCSDTGDVAPCVVSRSTVRGSVEIVFVLEPGDPPAKAW